jgi:hypothetical protein
MHNARNTAILFAFGLAITACNSEQNLTRTFPADISVLTRGVQGSGSIADEFKRLSATEPGFTGVFIDSVGDLTITTNRDGFSTGAVARIADWASNYARTTRTPTPRVRLVKYDYLTLSSKLDEIHQLSSVVERVVTTGIDETEGKLHLGLTDAKHIPDVSEILLRRGIPSDMVTMEVIERPVAAGTLNQRYRPLVGGLEIRSPSLACTLGFNFLKWETGIDPANSPKYFITAGHCNGNWGNVTGAAFSQVTIGVDRVGQEHQIAPLKLGDPSCPVDTKFGGFTPCFDADVLVGAYDDSVSVLYGRVATVYMPSKVIHNTLSVVGTTSGGITGQTVHLVAAVTGQHNTGKIKASCENIFYADPLDPDRVFWVLCTQRTDNITNIGDSGAPYFILYNPSYPNTTPAVVGIHVAGTGSSRSWLSPINQIDKALGPGTYYWQ